MKHEVLPLNIVSTLEQGQGICFLASVFTPLHLRYGHDDNKMNLLHRIVAYEAHRIHESAVLVANIINEMFLLSPLERYNMGGGNASCGAHSAWWVESGIGGPIAIATCQAEMDEFCDTRFILSYYDMQHGAWKQQNYFSEAKNSAVGKQSNSFPQMYVLL